MDHVNQRQNWQCFPFRGGRTGWQVGNTYTDKKARIRRMGRHACDRRPNFLVGFFSNEVSFCQVWLGFVHLCRKYDGKFLPLHARVNI